VFETRLAYGLEVNWIISENLAFSDQNDINFLSKSSALIFRNMVAKGNWWARTCP
jgi:hypothetical protein